MGGPVVVPVAPVFAAVLPAPGEEAVRQAALLAAPHEVLCRPAADPDLVVVDHAGDALVRRARCSVLVARPCPRGVPFPARILLADDGTPAAELAATLATAIARRHGATVFVAAPVATGAARRARIAEHVAGLGELAGLPEPALVHGHAHREIVALARRLEVSLVVVGSRDLHGLHAVTSVSGRVAREAPCSVLVARAWPPRTARPRG